MKIEIPKIEIYEWKNDYYRYRIRITYNNRCIDNGFTTETLLKDYIQNVFSIEKLQKLNK